MGMEKVMNENVVPAWSKKEYWRKAWNTPRGIPMRTARPREVSIRRSVASTRSAMMSRTAPSPWKDSPQAAGSQTWTYLPSQVRYCSTGGRSSP